MIPSELNIERRSPETLVLAITGDWIVGNRIPQLDELASLLASGTKVQQILYDTGRLQAWNSALLVFLTNTFEICRRDGISIDVTGLPPGVRKLMDLASPEKQRSGVTHGGARPSFLVRIADAALGQMNGIREMVAFIGDSTLAFGRMLRGKANFRRIDLVSVIQETGVQALPIVTLISLLVGMILAFIASIQLKMFGAQIFVADVVGIGIVRVMGAIMTGIIMAGRTGAAFAAQLGTMQVNEEIDALETLGLSPVEFLVLPRMLALMLMMPLLCIYSDLMGVLGGMIVGVGMLDLGVQEYFTETKLALNLTHLFVGLFHCFVFGIIVAVSGCLRGIQCERSATAVGYAATSAVVTAIVSIVVATAIITLSCQVLGI